MNNAERERENLLQERGAGIVRNEVYGCNTSLVEYILQKSMEGDRDAPFDWEEINLYPDPVAEEWGAGKLLEAIDENGIGMDEIMQDCLLLDPDDYIPNYTVERWSLLACQDAFEKNKKGCGFDLFGEMVAVAFGVRPGEKITELGEDEMRMIRQWMDDYLDTDPIWPPITDDSDIIDLEEIREYLRDNVDFEPREVFEWWKVSGWLADKLEGMGEIILAGEYWGRQCTGQSIYMDPEFRQLAQESLRTVYD